MNSMRIKKSCISMFDDDGDPLKPRALKNPEKDKEKGEAYVNRLDVSKESSLFLLIELPNRIRVFEWFSDTAPNSKVFEFVRHISPSLTNREIFIHDKDTQEYLPKDEQPLKRVLFPIHKGSTRTRYCLQVTLKKKFKKPQTYTMRAKPVTV